jgi:2-polyprenyl-3-methyl-5-hydroxy-6-metoxy-1,4-benzoquinol methylase
LFDPFAKLRKHARDYAILFRRLRKMPSQIEALTASLEEHRRETRLYYQVLSLPPQDLWHGRPPMVQGAPAKSAFPNSAPCRQESFEAPYFAFWARTLQEPLRYHRKLWEFVFICQSLWERGAIREGARGLGFGVGSEPLSAFFASQGCQVTATDMDVSQAEELGWTATNQHAVGKAALRKSRICPDDLFEANVSFRTCDMNAVPDDLTGFDFCWSACALEHLGSIEKGLAFIERSIECLKPGGLAIHTTEFNTSSDAETIDNMGTVLFRRRDFKELARRLKQKGHKVAAFDFNLGDHPVDRFIDVPPYRPQPHLQMALMGFSTTSFGLIVRRAA